jgi:hypothetical protein
VTALFQRALRQISYAGDKPPVSLDVYTHTVVSAVERSSHSPYRWTVQTSRGPILARSVIHATNGYASSIIPSLSSGPSRIVPTRGQVLSYSPQPTSNPRWTTAFSGPHQREYFFQRPEGGPVIIGGARAAAGAPYEFGVSDDSQVNERVEAELRGYLPQQFPRWFADGKEGQVEQSWTGVMGYRIGGVPLVSSPARPFLSLHISDLARSSGRPALRRWRGSCRAVYFVRLFAFLAADFAGNCSPSSLLVLELTRVFLCSAGYSGHGVVRAPVWYALALVQPHFSQANTAHSRFLLTAVRPSPTWPSPSFAAQRSRCPIGCQSISSRPRRVQQIRQQSRKRKARRHRGAWWCESAERNRRSKMESVV